ncbi:hypothetical protein GCK32_012037, partial [Trichostrongylus colubriformis]
TLCQKRLVARSCQGRQPYISNNVRRVANSHQEQSSCQCHDG